MTIAKKGKTLFDRLAIILSGKPVVYHHVPRCGGTTIARAFRLRYVLSQTSLNAVASVEIVKAMNPHIDGADIYADVREFRDYLLLYLIESNICWISGHFRFSELAFERYQGSYKFITVLRDPIHRFLSDYYANLGSTSHSGTKLSLEQYIDSVPGQMRGCVYSEYFSGLPAKSDFTSSDAVKKAIVNLKKLDLIGYTDQLRLFSSRASRLLGITVRVGHENKGGKSGSRSAFDLSRDIKSKLEKTCEPDIKIYQAIRKLGSAEQ